MGPLRRKEEMSGADEEGLQLDGRARSLGVAGGSGAS